MILPFFILWGVEPVCMTLLVKRGNVEVAQHFPARTCGKSDGILTEGKRLRSPRLDLRAHASISIGCPQWRTHRQRPGSVP
jgi:hypothetical protein